MEFTMKKLLAIFAVLALLTSFGYAQTTQDNCHASAQGTFSFTVEEAITVTVEVGEVDLGGVCPGCYVNFEMGDKCLIWNVDGGDQCYWEINPLMAANGQKVQNMSRLFRLVKMVNLLIM